MSVKESQKVITISDIIMTILVIVMLSMALILYTVHKDVIELRNQVLPRADVMMLDMEGTVQKLIADGMTSSEAVIYTNTMMKVLRARGVMVIDAKSVLSVPESAKIGLIEKEKLYQIADDMGLAPTEKERSDIHRAIEASNSMLDLSRFKKEQ